MVKAGGPLSPKHAVKQYSGGRYLQLVQRAIKTIMPLWRQFHADADADSVSSTVIAVIAQRVMVYEFRRYAAR